MKAIFIIVLTLIIFSLVALGQNNVSTLQKSSDPNETVIKYEEFLREETKNHRIYTQEYYDMIWKLLSGVGIVVGGVLAWLNWKSKEDIKKQINEQFKDTVQALLDEKIKQIDNLIKDGKDKSTKQFEEIGKIILELSAKSDGIPATGKYASQEAGSDLNALRNKKVLWVDDVPSNNDYPRQALEQAGVEFISVLSTEKAINALKKYKFDLIISDMGRNGNYTAGLDLLRELQRLGVSTPAIIYASPVAIDEYGKEAIMLGAIAVTTGVTTLLNVVQKILQIK